MKILVTGGLGFIGSNFILKLLTENNDYEIINVDAELFGADHKNLSVIKNSEKYHFRKVIFQIKNLWKNKLQNVMQ